MFSYFFRQINMFSYYIFASCLRLSDEMSAQAIG